MVPEELFKRRRGHKTPKPTLLIITNFITVMVAVSLFTSCNKINWFFWVILGGVAVYNFFDIRRYHEEYNRITIISYCISVAVLVFLLIIFRVSGQGC